MPGRGNCYNGQCSGGQGDQYNRHRRRTWPAGSGQGTGTSCDPDGSICDNGSNDPITVPGVYVPVLSDFIGAPNPPCLLPLPYK